MPVPSVSDVLSIPTRWGGVNNAVAGITDYLARQQSAVQGLQLQQAQDLNKSQTMFQMYNQGQRSPWLDKAMSDNPYAKRLLPSGGQGMGSAVGGPSGQPGANGMPSGGSMPVGLPTMGGQPAMGMMPGNGGMPTGAAAMGGSFNPFSGAQSPVTTEMSQTFKPFGDMGPSTTTKTANPQGEALLAGAKAGGSAMGEAVTKAGIGTIRDNNQLQMVAQSLAKLNQLHEDLSNSKVLGFMPAAGDEYGSKIAENSGWIPQAGGLQNVAVPADVQNKVGQFISGRNELIMKTMPMETQQFGQAGSVRIMDGVLKMMNSEIGDLGTPREQFKGQMKATLGTLYRIQQASAKYQSDLQASGQAMPNDPNVVEDEIYKRLPELTSAQQKQLDALVTSSLKTTKTPATLDSLNPLNRTQGQTSTQPQSGQMPSRDEIMAELQRRKQGASQ